MPATQFVVNYSATTGRIRAIYVFPEADENDAHLDSVLVGQGEKQQRLPVAQLANHVALQPVINALTGMTQSDLFDCFDAQGNYVTTIAADPVGCGDGPPPGCATMIVSIGATAGTTLVGKALIPAPVRPAHQDAKAVGV